MKIMRAVPWLLVLALLKVLFEHYNDIDIDDRRKMNRSLVRTKGKLHTLTPEEREHLRQVAKNLNHKKLAYDLSATVAPFPTPKLFKEKPSKGK